MKNRKGNRCLRRSLVGGILRSAIVTAVDVHGNIPNVVRNFESLVTRCKTSLFIAISVKTSTFFAKARARMRSPLVSTVSVLYTSRLRVPNICNMGTVKNSTRVPVTRVMEGVKVTVRGNTFVNNGKLARRSVGACNRVLG